ncbi:hypothetical protein [Aurantiacibacter zhengii]|uniref:Uncharacterized protein n=1 Tax=Aurantiacibacter zhengii TaxID=2307003 RepID=A0A418NU88_9SPHN|nr:hypothetical protein [Aurantiacibacter zhengii]RIV87500.1 hypothetical protein D2V07_03880 [Aurantiacibacter zhengii]
MFQFKTTGSFGGNDIEDIAIEAGDEEAQSDTISINMDITNMGKAEALHLLGKMVDRIHAAPWPPLA